MLIDELREIAETEEFIAYNKMYRLLPQIIEELERNETLIREVYEVYAEGFVTETAPEGYQKKIIEDMAKLLRDCLSKEQ